MSKNKTRDKGDLASNPMLYDHNETVEGVQVAGKDVKLINQLRVAHNVNKGIYEGLKVACDWADDYKTTDEIFLAKVRLFSKARPTIKKL